MRQNPDVNNPIHHTNTQRSELGQSDPGTALSLHFAQLTRKYQRGPECKNRSYNSCEDGSRLKPDAFALMSTLLFLPGIKRIFDSVQASYDCVIVSLIRLDVALAFFMVGTPILFFLVLGLPYPD